MAASKRKFDFFEALKNYGKRHRDLTVCSSDGKEFMVSEFLFAAHSEELATHLKYKKGGRLNFKHISSIVMEEIIHYLETGNLKASASLVAFDLAEFANMYNLPGLFTAIEPELVKLVQSDIVRAMRIANLFDSYLLFKEIASVKSLSESHFNGESGDIEIKIDGHVFKINRAFIRMKNPILFSKYMENKFITTLEKTPLPIVEGFIDYLRTSSLSYVKASPFDYARLAEKFNFADILKLVETELVSNPRLYDHQMVKNYAEKTRSIAIYTSLAGDLRNLLANRRRPK